MRWTGTVRSTATAARAPPRPAPLRPVRLDDADDSHPAIQGVNAVSSVSTICREVSRCRIPMHILGDPPERYETGVSKLKRKLRKRPIKAFDLRTTYEQSCAFLDRVAHV